MIIEGRLAAAGTLDGPLQNVTFRGTARQQDGDRPPSTATGPSISTPARDSLALATDVVFEPLSFEGIRRAFPTLKTRGELRGRFRSEGTLSRLAVDADLTGDLGDVQRRRHASRCCRPTGAPTGCCSASPGSTSPRSPGRTLSDLARRRAARHREHRHPARARGRARAGPHAGAASASGPSTACSAVAACRDSVIRVDTAYAEWQGARAVGRRARWAGARRTTGGCASPSRPTA